MTSTFPDPEFPGIADGADASSEFSDFAAPLNMADLPFAGAEQLSTQNEDPQEAELNRAIEELRGVLHEDKEGGRAEQAGGSAAGFSPAGMASSQAANTDIIMNIPVEVQIVLGSAQMSVSELMALRKGSTVSLNRRIGEPVDIVVNGRKIASGEITVLENDPSRFGIRLTQIIDTAKPA